MAIIFPDAAITWSRFDMELKHPQQFKHQSISGKLNVLTLAPGHWEISAVAEVSPAWAGVALKAANLIDAWLASLDGVFSATNIIPPERFPPISTGGRVTSRLDGTDPIYTLDNASGFEVGHYCRAGGRLYKVLTVSGNIITLSPKFLIDVGTNINASNIVTVRLEGDTPIFRGDPEIFGPWQIKFVEVL